jgi:hypothetical protein
VRSRTPRVTAVVAGVLVLVGCGALAVCVATRRTARCLVTVRAALGALDTLACAATPASGTMAGAAAIPGSGSVAAAAALCSLVPDDNLTVVLLMAQDYDLFQRVMVRIANVYLPDATTR